MGLSLAAARVYVPQFIKRRKLVELFEATADAFHTQTPLLKGLAFDECLKSYALFTREKAEEAIKRKTEPEVRNRLYRNSLKLGQNLKRDFRINTMEDAMRMSQIVYKILGIEFRGDSQGDIVIGKCYFSPFYSGEVCRVISSLDDGLLAGLSGGGKLKFQQRITEGNECCRARLRIQRSST
jgi:hypothetical protein